MLKGLFEFANITNKTEAEELAAKEISSYLESAESDETVIDLAFDLEDTIADAPCVIPYSTPNWNVGLQRFNMPYVQTNLSERYNNMKKPEETQRISEQDIPNEPIIYEPSKRSNFQSAGWYMMAFVFFGFSILGMYKSGQKKAANEEKYRDEVKYFPPNERAYFSNKKRKQ